MEDFIQKLTALLLAQFPGAQLDIERATPGTKVGGFLIWPGFEGKEQIDRQTNVWDVLRGKLPREEQLRIAAILTMTPQEIAGIQEG